MGLWRAGRDLRVLGRAGGSNLLLSAALRSGCLLSLPVALRRPGRHLGRHKHERGLRNIIIHEHGKDAAVASATPAERVRRSLLIVSSSCIFEMVSMDSTGEDPDLESLILKLVDPPFKKVGVFPLDRFFKPDDRMNLAMQLNGVVAAPSFAPWTRGIPLDMDALLSGPPGRPPVSIFNIAHLDEGQRHFFVGLLFVFAVFRCFFFWH